MSVSSIKNLADDVEKKTGEDVENVIKTILIFLVVDALTNGHPSLRHSRELDILRGLR